jgi:hypothetical protein
VRRRKPFLPPPPEVATTRLVRKGPKTVAPEATQPISSADQAYTQERDRRRAAANAIKRQMDAENAAEHGHGGGLFNLGVVRAPSLAEIGKELQGQGYYASILHGAGEVVAGKVPRGLLRHSVQDIFDLPAQAVPSLYVPLASAFEAVKGRPQRGKAFLKNLKENDPIALTLQGKLSEAGKAAYAHPVATGLEVTGVGASISRGAGALMRSRVAGAGLREAAALERAPKTVPGTSLRQRQTYSRGIVGKKAQQARERRAIGQSEDLRTQARAAEQAGHEDRAQSLRQKADSKDPFRMGEADIRRRVNEFEGMSYSRQRTRRDQRLHEVDQAMKGRAVELVGLVTQAITKASPKDLKAYAEHVEQGAGVLSPAKRDAALTTARRIRKAVDSGKVDPTDLRQLAATYGEMSVRLEHEAVKRGILDPTEAERARLIPYAVQHMDAKHRPTEVVYRKKSDPAPEGEGWQKAKGPGEQVIYSRPGRIEHANGEMLTNAEIKTHMRDPAGPGSVDPNSVGFLSHTPEGRTAGSFYRHWFQRSGGGMGHGRTGGAVREGTFDLHPEVLRENIARLGTLIDTHDNYASFWREFGAKVGGDVVKPMSRRDVEAMKRHLNTVEGGVRWRAIPANPLHGRQAELQALRDAANIDPLEGTTGVRSPVVEAVEDALKGKGRGGRWVLVPETAADQALAHVRVLGPGAGPRALRTVTSAFRRTVLATSLPWLTGNTAEGGFRSAIVGAGPRSYRLFNAVEARLKQVDPEAAEQLGHRVIPGGEAGLTSRATLHTDAEQFRGTGYEGIARTLGAVRRMKGPKQAADAWNSYTTFVFDRVNRSIESKFQKAMAGRYIKRELLDPKGLRLNKEAIEQAAQGLRDTNEQVALARYVERAYGKYNAFSPEGRQWIALYTPFAAWTINAVRFLASVLPKDHPALTAAIAASYMATQEWRAKHGLAKYLDGAAPGFLQGSIPVGQGKLRLSRYLPFGVAADPAASIAGLVLPQARSALAALNGQDWKGRELSGPGGKALTDDQKLERAFVEFAKSTVPALAQGQRVAQKGPAALNPFAPVKPPAGAKVKDAGPGAAKPGQIDWSQAKVGGASQPKIDWGQVKIGG